MWAVESLKFCTLVESFCPIHIKFQLKSAEELSLMTLKSDAKLKKNWLVVSIMAWGIWWIFTQPLKSLKSSFRWALFVQSKQGLSYKNTEDLSFMTLNTDAKFE